MDNKFDWKQYLSQFDVIYECPSRIWQDGIAMGNGSLGALAFEHEGVYPEWTINKNDVWDYRHPEFKRHSMDEVRKIVSQDKDYHTEMCKENIPGTGLGEIPGPKTCGQLRIRFGHPRAFGTGHSISKRLSLYKATLYTNLDKHLSHPRVSSFICANKNILVVQVRDVSVMTAFNNKVDLFRYSDSSLERPKVCTGNDMISLDQSFPDGFRYVMMVRVVPKGGGKYKNIFRKTVDKMWWDHLKPSNKINSKVEGECAVASVAGDFDIFLTVVTNLEAKDPEKQARNNLEAAVCAGSSKLHSEHCRWWSKFWPKNYVGIDIPLLEQLWYVSQYHLASAARGVPIGGLYGLWYGKTEGASQVLPWMGCYTNDYNAQLPIMPTFRINHPELAESAFRTLLKQLPAAKRNARQLYNLPGAFYPLTTDPTGEEITSGPYRFCQNSGPYWGIFLWWHYLYTKDKEFLRAVSYPIMREVAMFFTHYLTWHDEEKFYHLEISQNPELMYIKYPDPIDTLVMLKYTLSATVEAAGILNCDQKLIQKCQHVLDHYPDYPRHDKGFLPLRGLRPDHINHLRTLAGLFPTGELDPEVAPQWYDICHKEINNINWDFFMTTYACNKGSLSGWTGKIYHRGMAACRLGNKEMAWKHLEDLLKGNVKPNGLISHNMAILSDSSQSEKNIDKIPDIRIYDDLGPTPLKLSEVVSGRLCEESTDNLECKEGMCPAFEGPAVYLLLVGEMLLQSHNGILRLFAGLPDDRDAVFVDLRAEGPSLVSTARNKGKVSFVKIKALRSVKWRLINPWLDHKMIWQSSSRSQKTCQVAAEKYIELNLLRGEEVILAVDKNRLYDSDNIKPRQEKTAQARKIVFKDGMIAWLGKPRPSVYYSSLENARTGHK